MDKLDDPAVKTRRRQIDSEGSNIQTLLNSLSLEQIREVVYRLAPSKRISLRAHAQSLEAVLSTGATTDVIEATLLDVESKYPFKHCLLLRVASEQLPEISPEIGTIYASGDFRFKLSHINRGSTLTLTFEHSVELEEWVEVSKDHRVRQKVFKRHPIVVRVQPTRHLLTLSYPGYTSNSSGVNVNGYEKVLSCLLRVLLSNYNWSLTNLPIQNALRYFVEGTNKRVLQVQADVDTELARFDVSAKGELNNIEEALASFISEHLPNVDKAELIAASKKAFSNATPNSMVLFWIQESLFTRLRFWDIGTELHFVWNKESASYLLVDEITYTLSEASNALAGGSGPEENPLAWVSLKPSLSIILPAELSQIFQLAPGEARSSLLTALKVGLVEPVYRLATTEILEDFFNDWSTDLSKFRRILLTVNGNEIDGSKPDNLEVAFRRVSAESEVA